MSKILDEIKNIACIPLDTPDEEVPRLVKVWGCRREADGISEGRDMELRHQLESMRRSAAREYTRSIAA